MTPANAFLVVDETLKKLTDAGLTDAGLTPKPDITIGPLDRDDEGPRLNWFLYRIMPHAAFQNMEHPRTGPRNRRGAPPVTVRLHYLLTAYGAAATTGGDQEQAIHVALAAVMRRLRESAVIATGSPFLPTPPPSLIEPLHITLEDFDLENAARIWTAAAKPLRLSLAYQVSPVTIEPRLATQLAPPVTTTRILASPLPQEGP